MTAVIIAEQDRDAVEKLVDEATCLRSREAFSALVELAYAMGRRAGYRECREIVVAPTRSGHSEGHDHG